MEAGNILATSLTYWGKMMSWLQEEIGIPLEPKHSKVVRPVIQTARGRKTEQERGGERQSVKETFKKKKKEREKRNKKDGGFG